MDDIRGVNKRLRGRRNFMRYFVLYVILVLVSADTQLQFVPPDPKYHMENQTVKVNCNTDKSTMDTVKIIKTVDNVDYVVATETTLKKTFKTTGRYVVGENLENTLRTLSLSIDILQPEDSGNIRCLHVPLSGEETSDSQDFKVLVAPRKVEILAYNDGIPVGERVVLHEGKDDELTCHVVTDGAEDEPTTTLTLTENDGFTTDVLGMFVKEQNHTLNANNGLVQRKKSILYQHLTNKEPDTYKLHGRKLTCTASLPGMPSKSASADIEVIFGPKVMCETAFMEMNHTVITCSAKMHPPLELASVSWNNNKETVTLTRDSPEMDRFSFEVKNTSLVDYELSLNIQGVTADDIHKYNFEIRNNVNTTKTDVDLGEVQTSTMATDKTSVDELPTPDTTATSVVSPTSGVSIKAAQKDYSKGGSSHVLSSVLLVVMATFLSTRP